MAEFSTAYPAPYPFTLGQRSPFTDDPAEVKGLSLEAKATTLEAEGEPNSPSRQRQQW